MLCSRYKRLLIPYSEGILDPRRSAKVERHLLVCARCRAELEAVRSVSSALRETRSPAVEPAPDLWAKVSARIADEAPERSTATRWIWGLAPAAAAVIVAAAIGIGMLGRDMPTTTPAPERHERIVRAPLQKGLPKHAAPETSANAPKPARPREEKPTAEAVKKPVEPDTSKLKDVVVMARVPNERLTESAGGLAVSSPARPSEHARYLAGSTSLPRALEASTEYDYAPAPAEDNLAAERATLAGEFGFGCAGREMSHDLDLTAHEANPESEAPESAAACRGTVVGSPTRRHAAGEELSDSSPARAGAMMASAAHPEDKADFYRKMLAKGSPTVLRGIANEAKEAGVAKKLEREYYWAFQNTAGNTQAGYVLYELQAAQNDVSGMVSTANTLVQQNPQDQIAWFRLGEAYEEAGDEPNALDAYDNASQGWDPAINSIAADRSNAIRANFRLGSQQPPSASGP